MSDLRAQRIAAFLRDIAGEDGVEALRVDEERLETIKDANRTLENLGGIERRRPPVPPEALNGALEKIASGQELPREQARGIEAIIIPDKRPVMPLTPRGSYQAVHKTWLHLNDEAIKDRLTRAARSIGRIEVPGSQYPYGGTGFVVAPKLIMTNRHVAEIFVSGVGDRNLRFLPGIAPGFSSSFAPDNDEEPPLAVTGIKMIHPYWDMALLEVAELTAAPLTLSPREVATYQKEEIAVIGYPAFDPRNDQDVQLKLFDRRFSVKQLQPGLLRERQQAESFGKIVEAPTHDCSTLGGNSGSAVIHIASGAVLGLHFGGEYLLRNFAVAASDLAMDGRVVNAGVNFDPEASPAERPSWSGYWSGLDGREEAPAEGKAEPSTSSAPVGVSAGGEMHLTIPLQISVRLGEAGAPIVRLGETGQAAETQAGPNAEKLVEPAHDTDYALRRGYDAMFMGTSVPFPTPKDPAAAAPTLQRRTRLDYQNFSIIMHARRRLALVSGANLSAEAGLRRPEAGRDYTRKALGGLGKNDQERWFPDTRLEARYQLPDVFYAKDDGAFDKGHIVRREDVAWGDSYETLRRANGDSFHVTNCSPQIAVFNQSARGRENWGDLENLVLKQAASEKLCVFAGPVLAPDDPRFLGYFGEGKRLLIQIPVKFWKIIVAKSIDGIAAFGFVLEQDLRDVPTTEFAVPEAFQPFMMPVDAIASLAGLVFDGAIVDADQFDRRGPELALQASIGRRRGIVKEEPGQN